MCELTETFCDITSKRITRPPRNHISESSPLSQPGSQSPGPFHNQGGSARTLRPRCKNALDPDPKTRWTLRRECKSALDSDADEKARWTLRHCNAFRCNVTTPLTLPPILRQIKNTQTRGNFVFSASAFIFNKHCARFLRLSGTCLFYFSPDSCATWAPQISPTSQ